MTFSENLWQSNKEVANTCLEHPFVKGIADGTLPPEKYAFYVEQDVFFLESSLRAYSMAAAKAPDLDAIRSFHKLAHDTLVEISRHEKYAKEWNIKLQSIKAAPATWRYTDFLLATAWRHDIGITAAAVTPCVRLYVFLGQEIARNSIPEHRYSDWIRANSAKELEQLALQLEKLIDQYAENTQPVYSAYNYAMFCELDFFDAAWNA